MTPPLSDPAAALAADMKVVLSQLAKIERQLDRVVYRDIYAADLKAIGHRIDDVEESHDQLAADLVTERERRVVWARWFFALVVPIMLSTADDIARLFIHP